jgi:hypothetical protein
MLEWWLRGTPLSAVESRKTIDVPLSTWTRVPLVACATYRIGTGVVEHCSPLKDVWQVSVETDVPPGDSSQTTPLLRVWSNVCEPLTNPEREWIVNCPEKCVTTPPSGKGRKVLGESL